MFFIVIQEARATLLDDHGPKSVHWNITQGEANITAYNCV